MANLFLKLEKIFHQVKTIGGISRSIIGDSQMLHCIYQGRIVCLVVAKNSQPSQQITACWFRGVYFTNCKTWKTRNKLYFSSLSVYTFPNLSETFSLRMLSRDCWPQFSSRNYSSTQKIYNKRKIKMNHIVIYFQIKYLKAGHIKATALKSRKLSTIKV